MELLGRRHRLIALLELGDIPGADFEIAAYESVARALREPRYLWYVPMWRAMRALMEGRFNDCDALTKEFVRVGELAHSENANLLAEVVRWNVLHKQGRLREAGDALREQLELVPGVYGESFWVGLVAPDEFPAEAKSALGRLAPSDFAELPRDSIWLCGMSGVADACEVVRDTNAAETALRLLLPFRDHFAYDGTATACYGSMSRYIGELAGVLGRVDDAARHFEAALDAHRRAGASALVADTLRVFGGTLIAAGEQERAAPLLREALAYYAELGMEVRAKQVDSMLAEQRDGAPNAFRRDGDVWTLSFDGRTIRLKDAKGLRDIATLIARPGREVHVADLISSTEGMRTPAGATEELASAPSSAEELLDAPARAAYRERLRELQEDLDEAEQFGDIARGERARIEMDAVAGELASALGLGGRARRTANPAERARKAVAQRVRNALRRIDVEHPSLARHLDHSLRLGSFCSYVPEREVEWDR
jgi:tetratricopeptide (TPR) repeat protein